jgi:hypothetical protein
MRSRIAVAGSGDAIDARVRDDVRAVLAVVVVDARRLSASPYRSPSSSSSSEMVDEWEERRGSSAALHPPPAPLLPRPLLPDRIVV